jgi:hypothetical protein
LRAKVSDERSLMGVVPTSYEAVLKVLLEQREIGSPKTSLDLTHPDLPAPHL